MTDSVPPTSPPPTSPPPTSPPPTSPPPLSHDALRWGAGGLGVALAVLLVAAGLLSREDGSRAWIGSGALLAVLVAAGLLAAQLARGTARPWIRYALVPVSAGLATLTWLLGWTGFPGTLAWWIPGAVVSALPLWALGALGPARVRPPRATDRR